VDGSYTDHLKRLLPRHAEEDWHLIHVEDETPVSSFNSYAESVHFEKKSTIRRNGNLMDLAVTPAHISWLLNPGLWYTNLQKIIAERFPSDGVFCVFVVFWWFYWHGPHKKMRKCTNAQIAVPAYLNWSDITILWDSNWSQGLVLRVLAREKNFLGSICFKLTNKCWKTFYENYGKS